MSSFVSTLARASEIKVFLEEHVEQTLASYRAQPARIIEDWRVEEQVVSGGYGHRQVIELIQNGADQIQRAGVRGKVEVVLTDSTFYCANEGQEISKDGLRAMLMANMSDKTSEEIGRFGLGFKSILKVCDSPEFYSEPISFRFGGEKYLKQLSQIVGQHDMDPHELPKLRTAQLSDLDIERREDPILASLLTWATSVIRLPLRNGYSDFLANELDLFPAEFLLFANHVSELSFRIKDRERCLKLDRRDGGFRLRDTGQKPRYFKVFTGKVQVSELSQRAFDDMDRRLRERSVLPITWAVPTDTLTRERGKFWAFFPTQSLTAVQGIVNAPWKTNSDRQNLVEEGSNAFNAELARKVSELIARNISSLATKEDIAKHLDSLPLTDTNGATDRTLVESLRRNLSEVNWLPSNQNRLHTPKELMLRPQIVVKLQRNSKRRLCREAKELIAYEAEADARRTSLTSYGISEMPVNVWLERIEYSDPLQRSRKAILLAGKLLAVSPNLRAEIAKARIVLTDSGELVAPNRSSLVLPSELQANGVSVVCEELASDLEVCEILSQHFNIEAANAHSAFLAHASKVAEIASYYGASLRDYWGKYWELLRRTDFRSPKIRAVCLDGKNPIHVKSMDGSFKPIFTCIYLPKLCRMKGIDYARRLICDVDYHSKDKAIFEALEIEGFFALPEDVHLRFVSTLYSEHHEEITEQYRSSTKGQKPQPAGCKFRSVRYHAGIDLIHSTEEEAALFVTLEISKLSCFSQQWTMFYDRATKQIPQQNYPSALKHFVSKYGHVQTSLGVRRLQETVSDKFGEFSSFLPVVDRQSRVKSLVADNVAIVSQYLEDHLNSESDQAPEDDKVGDLYGLAAQLRINKPDKLWAIVDESKWRLLPAKSVYISNDESQQRLMNSQGLPSLICRNEQRRAALSTQWRLKQIEMQLRHEPSDLAQRTRQVFPLLRDSAIGDIVLQPCDSIRRVWQTESQGLFEIEVRHAFESGVLYYLSTPSDSTIHAIDALEAYFRDTHQDSLCAVRKQLEAKQNTRLANKVLNAETLLDKIAIAIGGENLHKNIPSRHLVAFEKHCNRMPNAHDLAAIALAVYGSDILKQYSEALNSQGLDAPRQWAGRSRERNFVRRLGFPDSFAGALRAEQPACEDVAGPIRLKPLHDFQVEMKEKALKFLNASLPQRAALSLPTGAGKTRVAVQSSIEWLRDKPAPTQIVWVAQSDELCEQAVQTWKQAWAALGNAAEKLRVCRFWGSVSSDIESSRNHRVIVATYQTLRSRIDDPRFAWVYDDTHLVIIDEAHGAIAPSYTQFLDRMGITRKRTRIPLLGLSATPFRGSDNVDESYRLSFRFNNQLLSHGPSSNQEFYAELQKKRVIARVEHDTLEGSSIELTREEINELEMFDRFPASAESRLGHDSSRNNRIVEKLLSLPNDWPVLLFAASAEHAEDLAVRLSIKGLAARCVSGSSSISQRRAAVRDFNAGQIRVLTNYGVLTTGFDAPSVRAIFITRPVFSKVLYQQMVGRGLRGPENGGKEMCLIVNVADNIVKYGRSLAFEANQFWETT